MMEETQVRNKRGKEGKPANPASCHEILQHSFAPFEAGQQREEERRKGVPLVVKEDGKGRDWLL